MSQLRNVLFSLHMTMTNVSPDPIFQMATGFWVSKTLMTAVELEVFTKLSGNKSVTFEQLQNDILEMDKRPAEVFATALLSLGLINVSGERGGGEGGGEGREKLYSNSQLSEVFLDKNKPSYIGDFIIMMDKRLYNKWGKLPVSLKTNRPIEAAEGGGGEGDDDDGIIPVTAVLHRSDEVHHVLLALQKIRIAWMIIVLAERFDEAD